MALVCSKLRNTQAELPHERSSGKWPEVLLCLSSRWVWQAQTFDLDQPHHAARVRGSRPGTCPGLVERRTTHLTLGWYIGTGRTMLVMEGDLEARLYL